MALAYMKDRADMDFVARMDRVLSKLDEEARPLEGGKGKTAEAGKDPCGDEPGGGGGGEEPGGGGGGGDEPGGGA